MEKTVKINYTFSNEPVSPETLRNSDVLLEFASKIEQCVYDSLKDAIGDSDIYSNIYIGSESVESIADEMLTTHDATLQERYNLCAILIANAQTRDYKANVTYVDYMDNEHVLEYSGALPTLQGQLSLSLLDLILDFLNFTNERIDAYHEEQKNNANTLKSAIKSNQENTIIERELHNKVYNDYVAYKAKVKQENSQIMNMYFGNIKPEEIPDTMLSKMKPGEKASMFKLTSKANFNERSIDTIAHCMMLNKGYSLRDIADPNFTDEREAVGREILALVTNIHSEDTATSRAAQKKLADIYIEGAQAFLKQKLPPQDEIKDFVHAKNPEYTFLIQRLGQDLGQEFKNASNETEFILTKPENHITRHKLMAVSNVGVFYPINKVAFSDLSSFETNQKYNSCVSFELMRQYVNSNINVTGNTLEDYILDNEGDAAFKQSAVFLNMQIRLAGTEQDEAEIPIDTKALFEGRLNIRELFETEDVEQTMKTSRSAEEDFGGTYAERTAKIELAKKMVQILLTDTPDATQLIKDKATCAIMANKSIMNLLKNKTTEQLTDMTDPKKNDKFYDFCDECWNALLYNPTKKEMQKKLKERASEYEVEQKKNNISKEQNVQKEL